MRKLIFSLVAAIVASTAMYAQSSLMATLNHEGAVSIFYGVSALSDALDAATHGDKITLSAGRFNAANITKAVTLYGAGMEEDSIRKTFPTIIAGTFKIHIPEQVQQKLTLEGIRCNNKINIRGMLQDATFQKCRLSSISDSDSAQYSSNVSNLTLVNCRDEALNFSNNSSAATINCINSVIGNPKNKKNTSFSVEFTNCIVYGHDASSTYSLYNSVFSNCIVYCDLFYSGGVYSGTDYYFILDSSNLAYNSVCSSGGSGSIFKNISNSSTILNQDLSNGKDAKMFKTGSYYELTDEAKVQYVGGDGTEMGIYGGELPFSSAELAPQIVKCNIGGKTTTDGKLNVELEIEAVE